MCSKTRLSFQLDEEDDDDDEADKEKSNVYKPPRISAMRYGKFIYFLILFTGSFRLGHFSQYTCHRLVRTRINYMFLRK